MQTYQLAVPLIKAKDAVYESLTYSSELYVSAGLICKSISSGIYYRSKLDHNRILKSKDMGLVSRKQQIPILVLSLAMGSNLREILDNVCYPNFSYLS
ncbi:DNA-directed RNA polymerase subunit beta [Bienertia sinuspersici]